jgi:hypothetical protein
VTLANSWLGDTTAGQPPRRLTRVRWRLRPMRIRFLGLMALLNRSEFLLRLAGFTRVNTLTEKSALHRITRQNERSAKECACNLVPSKAKLKFVQRGQVERVGREAITVGRWFWGLTKPLADDSGARLGPSAKGVSFTQTGQCHGRCDGYSRLNFDELMTTL